MYIGTGEEKDDDRFSNVKNVIGNEMPIHFEPLYKSVELNENFLGCEDKMEKRCKPKILMQVYLLCYQVKKCVQQFIDRSSRLSLQWQLSEPKSLQKYWIFVVQCLLCNPFSFFALPESNFKLNQSILMERQETWNFFQKKQNF